MGKVFFILSQKRSLHLAVALQIYFTIMNIASIAEEGPDDGKGN
jgi:hypothetical protein